MWYIVCITDFKVKNIIVWLAVEVCFTTMQLLLCSRPIDRINIMCQNAGLSSLIMHITSSDEIMKYNNVLIDSNWRGWSSYTI